MKHFLLIIIVILSTLAVSAQDSLAIAKSDSLYNRSKELFDAKQYNEAIDLCIQSITTRESITGKLNDEYVKMIEQLSIYHIYNYNYKTALSLLEEAFEIRKTLKEDNNEEFATLLSNIASVYDKLSNTEEALKYAMQALNIEEKIFGKEHPEYAETLINVAAYYSNLGKYNEAIELETEALHIYEKNFDLDNTNYADALNNLSNDYAYLGNYNEAIKQGTEALHIYEKILGKENSKYATTLSNLSNIYSQTDNFNESIKLTTEALQIKEKVLGKMHPDYASSLNSLANYYAHLNKLQNAIKLSMESLKIVEAVIGKENNQYIIYLTNLAAFYSEIGNYKDCIELNTEALHLFEKVSGKEHSNYAWILSNLADTYAELGDFSEAIKLETEALYLKEKTLGRNNRSFAVSLSNLAGYYSNLGNYNEAIKLGKEALGIKESVFGKNHSQYAISLNNLSSCYADLGNYNEAIKFSQESLIVRENVYGKDSRQYALALHNLACDYSYLGNHIEALKLNNEALHIREKVLGKDHPACAQSLKSLAECYYNQKNYTEAIKLDRMALAIREKALGKDHPACASSLNNLAADYANLNNYDEAIKLTNEALRIREKVLGKEHPDYLQSLYNLAIYYDQIKQVSNLEDCFLQYNNILPKVIKKSFNFLTEKEREFFWNQYQSFFINDIHIAAYIHQSSESLIKNASDAVLMGKGLLLNTSQEMRNLIAESGDSAVKTLYDELRMSRLMLDRLYETPIANRHMSTDSLERVANELERQLLEKSQEYGDYTRNLIIKWQDVQQALGAKDVAVEFVSFELNEDSTMYVAYVNKPGIDCPIFVPLFEEKQLKTRLTIPKDYSTQEGKMLAVADAYLPSQQVSELVWEPLAQYLDGAESIYFAPSGELYNLAIESLTDWDNSTQLMSDRWPGLCRVSSTREIAINRDRQPINSSVTYGGLKYDMNADLLTADSKKYGSQASSLETSSLMAMVKGQSGDTWRDMPITLDEAASVHESLNKAGVDDTPYLEEAGTEASFKSLSGQRKNMMFLSTHGFFWNTDEAKKHRREHTLQFVSLGNEDRRQSVEDMAMTRSGLLFSGANYAWQGNKLPDGVDDGFLTAKEISQLDLRGLGLVVLSACQTGLGDVSGEGVFGLQRGFKKAGAQSILMSLWEVNAYSTKLLMTEFCKNVFEKRMTKRDALRAAQEAVKNFTGDPESLATKGINITSHGVDKDKKDKKTKQQTEETITQPASDNHPFAHPYYWAGFILLDALD